MKNIMKSITALTILTLISCGGKEEKKNDGIQIGQKPAATETPAETPTESTIKPSETINLTDKGIGPIKSVEIPATIDDAMAAKGMEVYKNKCMACHKPDKKFVGPAPKGIMERRTPEWIMNMILNPEEMTQKDPLAMALMAEFNGSPMANQHLTEEEARQVLEYFRTL
ncbi:cytochrome c, mono- and diheme variants family [Aequorivita sublithincola DSM 14238]|uniref:Cytochrome c, mono-and diheme variants family n=1 Tax=Aequorivita sublithincola (strain DSM 14238 / LMG 21431 / ACAM 643 / 9-3) TaxID=746697 RepID=I3YRQ5_AEQSU|nr:cytochrome c [Aequorivita sublithincola]AFL79673.1 cytochrome c, mono- and diheme variants family [Aequorivita sublithincola DSM 14238]